MSGRKIEERSVSIPEVKEIMENLKDQLLNIDANEGMSHFQEITYNYVNKFAKYDAKIAKKVKKLLIEKYQIEEIYAINIINIDPKSVLELRMILEKSFTGKTLKDEQLEVILEEIEELKSS
ncbi:MAG: RNA polymerase Rpb4 [Candidatus Odinarchaeota archaeon]